MNYEEKYKHALENFKKIKSSNSDNKELVNFIEYKYTELKESEDEKIKQYLISMVKGVWDDAIAYVGLNKKDILAWLEKQAEQKPIIIIPQFKVGDIIKPKSYNEEHLIKDINENGYVLDVDIIIPFKDEDVWETVEQKPAWSGEDEKMLNKIIEDVMPVGECPDYPNEEERKYYYEGQDKVDWLKSLKPNHWKPSEGQMKSLKKSFEIIDNGFDKENIRSLYCALKHFF